MNTSIHLCILVPICMELVFSNLMYTNMNISIHIRVLALICMRPVFSGHNETFQFTSGHHYQTGHPAMNRFRTIHYNIEHMKKN